MKHLKLFEDRKLKFFDEEWVRITGTNKIGIILSTVLGTYSVSYIVMCQDNSCKSYRTKDLEKLTPEELEFYKNTYKYNL